MHTIPIKTEWRSYQERLKRRSTAKQKLRNVLKISIIFCLLLATVSGIIKGWKAIDFRAIMSHIQSPSPDTASCTSSKQQILTKKDIRELLDSSSFANLEDKDFDLVYGDQHFRLNTTLDVSLQNFILKKLEQLKHITRGKPRHMALVAMEPETGKILAMASFDQNNPDANPCISNAFPAASIFKIVTAAAAIEECGLRPASRLSYNGGKYTLYKRQLQNRENRYTNRITLKDAFAQSVNPVFGKIGAHYLDKASIEKYATAFGFNRPIDFEILLDPSVVTLTDKPYHLAEIACGFNRSTLISPLHGAMLGSAILNQGEMKEPTIVERVMDSAGNTVYSSRFNTLTHAIRPETSRQLKTLMKTTIRSGTGRKAFRDYKRDAVLSRLTIGGKTGSISNKNHDIRYDWFVGFAEEKKGNQKIAVAVVVGHQKYIGTRATQYARMAIRKYFQNHFAKNDANSLKTHRS